MVAISLVRLSRNGMMAWSANRNKKGSFFKKTKLRKWKRDHLLIIKKALIWIPALVSNVIILFKIRTKFFRPTPNSSNNFKSCSKLRAQLNLLINWDYKNHQWYFKTTLSQRAIYIKSRFMIHIDFFYQELLTMIISRPFSQIWGKMVSFKT